MSSSWRATRTSTSSIESSSALEDEPGSPALLASVFRTVHTIKGTCGFLGFSHLEALTHVGENLLSRLRDGELVLTPAIATALLKLSDAVRGMLAVIEETGKEGEADHADLADVLQRLTAGETIDDLAPDVAPASPDPEPQEAATPEPAPRAATSPEVDPVPTPEPPPPAPVPDVAPEPSVGPEASDGGEHRHPVSESTVRVDVGLLDNLITLVGELVLTRNQLVQKVDSIDDPVLVATAARLNLITTELQEGVMKTRMQPIGNVWSRFPRVVRDLAMACGKEVRIEMEGKETELDKTIIEAIKDPLTHLVRNAVDHGIEPPEVRRRRGKPAEGRLFLRAFHEGRPGQHRDRRRRRGHRAGEAQTQGARAGLASARNRPPGWPSAKLLNLIFLPGFSTAAKVSNVSGRGVGMDVVKTNIEKIGGTVDLHSQPGRGTTIKIKIPLTLAIIPALVVDQRRRPLRHPAGQPAGAGAAGRRTGARPIERIHGTPVYRLRGHLLPLVYLNRRVGRRDRRGDAADEAVNIVVLQADERHFGLVVDGINDTEEIVVKPLGKQLKGVPVFAGATIMGDGQVA